MGNASLKKKLFDGPKPPEDSYAWATTKTVLLGDFYDDPTWLGLGVRAALGCVPVLGQVLDLADTAAWVVLAYERGLDDKEVMLNGAILFIGYVPGVGDLLRSILKGLVSNRAVKGMAHVLELALNSVSKNQYKAVKEVVFVKWDKNVGKAVEVAHKFLDRFNKLLAELKKLLPDRLTNEVDQLSKFVTELRANVAQGFRDALEEPRELLEKLFKDFEETRFPVGAKATAKRVDGVVPPNESGGILVPEGAMVRAGDEAAEAVETTLRKRGTIPSEQWRDGVAKLEQPGDYFVISEMKGGKEGLVKALEGQPVEYAIRRQADTGQWYVIRGTVDSCPHLDPADTLVFHNHPPNPDGPRPTGKGGDAQNIDNSRKLRGKKGMRSTVIGTEEGTHRWSFRRGETGDDLSLIGGDSPKALKVRAEREAAIEKFGYVPSDELKVVGRANNVLVYEGGVHWDGTPIEERWMEFGPNQNLDEIPNGKVRFPSEEEPVLPPKRNKKAQPDGEAGNLSSAGKVFKAKFGEQGTVAYRGIRVRKGDQVQKGWRNPKNEGQMVILRSDTLGDPMDTAKHYAKYPGGQGASKLADDDELIVMSFRVRAEYVLEDHYDTMEHIILRPDVDLTSLEEFKEARFSLKPSPDLKGIPIEDADYRMPTTVVRSSHPKGADSPANPNTTGEPVDLVSGSVLAEETDFSLPGPLPLTFTRKWSSMHASRLGPLGRGWSHSLDQSLKIERDASVLRVNGRSLEFGPLDLIGQWDYNRGARMTLTRRKKGYTVLGPDKVTYAFGDVDRFDGALALVGMVDRNGNRIDLRYEEGLLVEVVDSAGRRLRFVNDEDGFLTAVEAPDPEGTNGESKRLVTYVYDDEPRLAAVEDALGNPFRYRYDDRHLITSHTDRNGVSFCWEYDTSFLWPRCTKTWGDGKVLYRELSYDRPHRITTVKDGAGNTWVYHGNTIGMVEREIDPLGNETLRDYDEDGNLLSVTDPNGNTTRFEYDDDGRMTAEVNPLGRRRELRYDRAGNAVALVEEGNTWQREYDDHGNMVATVAPDGARSVYEYDVRGFLVLVTDPAGNQTQLDWDQEGNLVRYRGPAGAMVEMTYNKMGLLIRRRAGEGESQLVWNERSELVQRRDSAGRTWSYEYDAEGNLLRLTLPDRQRHRFVYGPLGALVRSSTPSGATIHRRYDDELRLTGVKDNAGRHWCVDRDDAGRVVGEETFDGRRISYTYDRAGRLQSRRDGAGTVTGFEYDALGQLIKKILPDGNTETFEWDTAGRLMTATNAVSRVELRYDEKGNLAEHACNGVVSRNEFDLLGNRTRRLSPFGRALTFGRNGTRRVTSLAEGDNTLLRFDFDQSGQEIERRGPGGLSLQRSYGLAGELRSSRAVSTNGVLTDRTYAYDDAGRLARTCDQSFGEAGFEYDLDGRLQQAIYPDGSMEQFASDVAGNVPGVPRGKDNTSRQQVGDWALRWDEDGRLIEKKSREVHYTFDYDAAGRLAQVVRDVRVPASKYTKRRSSDPQQRRVMSYAYDALGRRISKRSTLASGETDCTNFVWDGDVLLGEMRDGVESKAVEYVFGEGSFSPVAQFDHEGMYLLECDHLNVPRAAFDSAGELVWQADFSAYGDLRRESGKTGLVPFRFPGQYADEETGLHYNRHRYYDPDLHLYTSPDPLGLAATTTPHNYSPNPLAFVDPMGLSCAEPTPAQAAVADATENIPGLKKDQAEVIFEQSFKRDSSVVVGGSRIRGNHRPDSDLDVGFGDMSNSQAGKVIKKAGKVEGGLPIEQTRIVPGNETASIPRIESPEEFFMRSGTRSASDPRAGEPFVASGYRKYDPSGAITHVSPDGTVSVIK